MILVSPWVALLIGQAQAPSVVAPAAEAAPVAVIAARSRHSLPDHVSAFAKLGVMPAAAAEAVSPPPQAPPHEISVACGKDGCVVQSGLEVMVVAGKPAR